MKQLIRVNGILMWAVHIALLAFVTYWVYDDWGLILSLNFSSIIPPVIILILVLISCSGFITISPNSAVVAEFMGKYKGVYKENGYHWILPIYNLSDYHLKVISHQTDLLRVNDSNGSPIDIAAVITYRYNDLYKAEYDVENVAEYLTNQYDVSLRKLAQTHTCNELLYEEKIFIADLQEKADQAGVLITDAKITHLNYAPEMQGVMLQKQQALAMNEAKEIVVNTAVYLANQASQKVVDMPEGIKSKMVADLVLVLCSEKGVLPIINL